MMLELRVQNLQTHLIIIQSAHTDGSRTKQTTKRLYVTRVTVAARNRQQEQQPKRNMNNNNNKPANLHQ